MPWIGKMDSERRGGEGRDDAGVVPVVFLLRLRMCNTTEAPVYAPVALHLILLPLSSLYRAYLTVYIVSLAVILLLSILFYI